MKVLVAGASGFIAGALAKVFKQIDDKIHMTGLSRKSTRLAYFDQVLDWHMKEPLSENFDVVINTAGPTDIWQDQASLRAAHLNPNQQLLEASRYRCYVLISSASVYMAPYDRFDVREDQASAPYFNAYAHIKREVELATISQCSSKPYYIVRPRMVLGKGDQTWAPHIFKHLQRRFYFAPDPSVMVQPTAVDYLAKAIYHLVRVQAEPGIYNVAQERPLSYLDLLGLFSDLLGKHAGKRLSWPKTLGQWLLRQPYMHTKPTADLLYNISCSLSLNCAKLAATGFNEPSPAITEVIKEYEPRGYQ